jgi:hypothetical protein
MKAKIFEMKTKILATILLIIFFVFVGQPAVMGVSLQIDSVDVIPYQPLETDIITFNISGWAATSPSQVEYDLFSQNGTSLQLDLYIERGVLYTPSNWTYSKQISPLPSDVYNLQVRAFDFIDGTLQDTYNVDFTVVPEPSTLTIFVFALSFFRNFHRRKTKGLQ